MFFALVVRDFSFAWLPALEVDIKIQGAMDMVGKHAWDVTLALLHHTSIAVVSKITQYKKYAHVHQRGYFTISLVPPAMLLIKISFFILFLRLFAPNQWLRYAIYFGATFTFCSYIALGTALIYYVSPIPGAGWHSANGNSDQIMFTYLGIAALGIPIDIYILILPIVAVCKLQLAMKNKVRLIAVFGIGSMYVILWSDLVRILMLKRSISACLASAMALYYRWILFHSSDFSWNVLPVLVWTYVSIWSSVSNSKLIEF